MLHVTLVPRASTMPKQERLLQIAIHVHLDNTKTKLDNRAVNIVPPENMAVVVFLKRPLVIVSVVKKAATKVAVAKQLVSHVQMANIR